MKESHSVPIHHKALLTVREAAAYSNIGINKLNSLLGNPNCNFVVFVGRKRLIRRREFEEFISQKTIL